MRASLSTRVLYYLSSISQKTPGDLLINIIAFFYNIFEISENNIAFNITMHKSVGFSLMFKDKRICYIKPSSNGLLVYIHPDWLLIKVAKKMFSNPLKNQWQESYKVDDPIEIERFLNYLRKLPTPKEKVSTSSRTIPSWIKSFVFDRDSGCCVACGSKKEIHFDHVLPFSKGGTSINPKNIQLLCQKCNLLKRDTFVY
jgi:hypothetical protein